MSNQNILVEHALALIENYKDANKNSASASKFDSNANVSAKNISTMAGELPKEFFIELNRTLMDIAITKRYGKNLADEYFRFINSHCGYKNDETNIANYCASITMYPWLVNGLKPLGGIANAPKNLKGFVGGFINLVFATSSQLSGAVATPEFLMYMTYFIDKEYGVDWVNRLNEIVDLSLHKRTIKKVIEDYFEQIVYTINEPTGARNFQAVFWNVAYYDKYYFNGIFDNFYFPDGTRPNWNNLNVLQKMFMKWLNKERERAEITFPVETLALLTDEVKPLDSEWENFGAEMYSEGHQFFTYMSDSPESLSSCCRLRNIITNRSFSYTLGAGGVSTGSKSVLTININRVVQNIVRSYDGDFDDRSKLFKFIKRKLTPIIDNMHKFQICYNDNLVEFNNAGLLPLFREGYININNQYLTIGVNGIVEAAEAIGLTISPNSDYEAFVETILGTIEEKNNEYSKDGLLFNCEMIPAENVGIKHAKWDKEDGYIVPRDCYNSYFYRTEDSTLSIIDKFKLHGERFIKHLTGGSANHINLDSHLSKDQYIKLYRVACKYKCNYLTYNIPGTICNDCGHIDKRFIKDKCPVCGSENLDYQTRIIGYVKRITKWGAGRIEEWKRRFYHSLINEE